MSIGEPLDATTFQDLAAEGVPYVGLLDVQVEWFREGDVAVRLPYRDLLLRPGGTICGPAIMALADIALYGIVLSHVGRVPLAVTTDLNVHFLAKPHQGDLRGHARTLKVGKRLIVGECKVTAVVDDQLVANVVGTYSVPPPPPA
ncbi:MAG: PaaI family thioesterase [Pseudomonadota bacterium]